MLMETRERFRVYADPAEFEQLVEYGDIVSMWKKCVERFGALPAVGDEGRTVSYEELDRDAALYRGVLQAAGLQKGMRAAVLVPNSYEFVKVFLAAETFGISLAILPPQLPAPGVFGCLMKFGAKALIYAPALEASVAFAKEKAPQVRFLTTEETSDMPAPMAELNAKDEAVIMFTGGTTGNSKGALLSQGALQQGTINGCYGLGHVFHQRYLLILPLSHVFGLVRNLMTALYTGSTLYICRNNKDMFRDIAMCRPTILIAVPALAEMALNLSRQFGKNMLGEDMKTIIAGAAAVAPYLITEYDKLGITVFPGYGLTESANLVSGNPEPLKKPESVGIPFPHQEFRIENNELWLKGLNMMEGYVGDDEENKAAYEDGWFKTGDLVRMDEDGFLYITGRVKEIIVLSNGENVSPAEVETYFSELPFVQDSQVFEAVEENGQHTLHLEIVPRAAELKKVEAEDKGAYMMAELSRVNASLPGHMQVSKIVIRDSDFERTPSMKIKRYKLS